MNRSESFSSFLFLTGFMGVGKTYYGHKVGERLQIPSLDLDREIERYEDSRVTNIFDKKGEAYFRKLEADLLSSILYNYTPPVVVSLGGGTLMNNALIPLVKNHGLLVYLQQNSFLTSQSTFENRPLLGSKNVRILFQERMSGYSAAHACIRVDMLTQKELVLRLINHWKLHEKAG